MRSVFESVHIAGYLSQREAEHRGSENKTTLDIRYLNHY